MHPFLLSIVKIRINISEHDVVLYHARNEKNWPELIQAADREGVAGLLYHHLKKTDGLRWVPISVRTRLRALHMKTVQNALTLLAETSRISSLFEKTGLSAIALQGLSVLHLYKTPGLRPLADIDLLIRSEHRTGFRQVFQEAGYAVDPLYPNLFKKNGMYLDIHTHLLNTERIKSRAFLFPGDLGPMWKRAVSLKEENRGILFPDPLDNIIALSAHALKHGYSRLIWLMDVNEMIRKYVKADNAWDGLIKRARFWRQEKILLYTLIILRDMFRTEYPEYAFERLGLRRMGVIEKFAIKLAIKGFRTMDVRNILWVLNIDGKRNKYEFLVENLLPDREVMGQIANGWAGGAETTDYVRRVCFGAAAILKTGFRFCRNHRRAGCDVRPE